MILSDARGKGPVVLCSIAVAWVRDNRTCAHLLSCTLRFSLLQTQEHSLTAMTRNQISPDVREFVRREIKSVFQLEVLLLLHRTPERAWTAIEISHELAIESEIAETQVLRLEEMGLIQMRQTSPVSYVYGPKDQADDTIVEKLATAYAKQRVGIFSLILSGSNNRIRRFAEAFRLIRGAD